MLSDSEASPHGAETLRALENAPSPVLAHGAGRES